MLIRSFLQNVNANYSAFNRGSMERVWGRGLKLTGSRGSHYKNYEKKLSKYSIYLRNRPIDSIFLLKSSFFPMSAGRIRSSRGPRV